MSIFTRDKIYISADKATYLEFDAGLATAALVVAGVTVLSATASAVTLPIAPTVSGALQLSNTLTVGVNDTGYDVKFFGATAGKSWLWDESADKMIVTGTSDLLGNTQQTGTLTVGVDGTGHDVTLFSATAGCSFLWDESEDQLVITRTSAATSGDIEPMVVATTMTGDGATGGRSRFRLDADGALGGWSNALKAHVVYGASGRTTGLGSAFVAEMDLSAGTSSGTYAPVEIELNLGDNALTGDNTSLVYASVNGIAAATFDTNGFFLTLAGVTEGDNKAFANGGTLTNLNEITNGLRCKIAGANYYILMATEANFEG